MEELVDGPANKNVGDEDEDDEDDEDFESSRRRSQLDVTPMGKKVQAEGLELL